MPADKEYLIFRNGATRTHEVAYTKPGYVSPPDVMIEWQPVNGDRNAENYVLRDGAVVYEPINRDRPPTYKDKRLQEFAKLQLGDQLDALYKAALRLGFVPDATQPVDTPEGWLAYIQDVKTRFPKR